MPSPYLSRIKLEKELEKKAQVLREKREKCEDVVSTVEEYLKILEPYEDVKDYRKAVDEAKKKLEIKEFDACLTNLEGMRDELKSKVEDVFNSEIKGIENAISGAGIEETAKIKADVEQAKEKFQESPAEAFKILEETKEKIGEMMKGSLERRKLEFLEKLSKIEGFDDIKKEAEKLDEKDIKSLEKLNSLEAELRKRVKEEIEGYISKARELIEIAKEARYSIPEDEEEVKLIMERFEAGDYAWSLNKAKEYHDKVKENFGLFFKKLMDIAKIIINEGTAMEVDMNIPSEMLHKAEEMYAEGKYKEAVAQIKKATEEAEKEKLQKVLEIIKVSREKILEAKKRGIDIAPYLELIENARNLIRIGRRKRAYDNVMKVIQQIDRKLNLYTQLKKELDEISSLLKSLQEEEIFLEGIEERVEEIRNTIEKDPEKAEKMIDELNNLIKIGLRDIANELYKDLLSFLDKASEIGLDFREERMEVENIETMLEDENYRDSILAIRDTEDKVYQKVYDFFEKQKEELKDDKELAEKLKELDKLLEEGEIEKAIEKYGEIRHILLSRQMAEYSKKLEEIWEKMKLLEELGENTVELRGYVDRARKAIEENDLNLLEGYLSQINEVMEKSFTDLAIRSYEAAKAAAEAAEKAGVDLEKMGINDLLSKVKENFDSKNFVEAIKYSNEAKEKARELKERMDNIQTLKAQLESIMEKMKSEGLDITAATSTLKKIEELIGNGKLEEAEKTLKESIGEMERTEKMKRLEALKTKIDAMGSVLKSTGKKDKFIEVAGDFLARYKEKKYDGLEELGQRTIETLNKVLKDTFTEKVNSLNSMVSDLGEVGVEVDSSPLDKARDFFYSGKFEEAFGILNKFEEEIKETYNKKVRVKRIEDEIDEAINLASSLNVDTEKYTKVIARIKTLDNIDAKEELALKLVKAVEKDVREKIEAIMDTVENEIDRLRKKGEDITTSEGLLHKAKEMMEEKKYRDALYTTFEAMREIERYEMQKSVAYGILKKVEGKVKMMRSLLPKDVLKEFEEAKSLFMNGNYEESIKKLMDVGDKIWDIEKIITIIKTKNQRIKEWIEQAKKMGLDVKNVLALLAKAKGELKKLDYQKALEYEEEAYKEAYRLVTSLRDKYREEYEDLLAFVVRYGVKDKFKNDIKEIDRALAENDVESLNTLFPQFKEAVMAEVSKRMDEMMKELHEKISAVIESGIDFPMDLKKEEKELEKLRKEDPLKFIDHYESVSREIDTSLPKIVKAKLNKLQKDFSRYENYDIKLTDYEEKMSKILKDMEKEDYSKILREISDLERNFDAYMKEFIAGKIEKVKERVSKYSKSKAEIFAEKMRKHLAKKEYLEALKVMDEVDNYIGEYKLKVSDFNKKALDLKELIKYGISIGLKLDKEVNELKSALKSIDDIDAATEELDRIEKVIREKIEALKPDVRVEVEEYQEKEDKVMAKLRVENNGTADAVNMIITIKGALETDKPINIGKLPKGSKQVIEAVLKKGKGDEVEIEANYYRFDGKSFSWSGKVKMEKEKTPGFRIEKAKEKVKCTFCHGTILKGLDIVVCEKCGAVYHVPCAKRAGKCLKCGTPFDFQ